MCEGRVGVNVSRVKGFETNLRVLFYNVVENGSICTLGMTGGFPRFRVILIALSETLGAKVVGISERLVDTLQRLVASHEDLEFSSGSTGTPRPSYRRTRSKAVEQALGWVATKMGFCTMFTVWLV